MKDITNQSNELQINPCSFGFTRETKTEISNEYEKDYEDSQVYDSCGHLFARIYHKNQTFIKYTICLNCSYSPSRSLELGK